MIYLGLTAEQKQVAIEQQSPGKVVIITDSTVGNAEWPGAEVIDWPGIIKYKNFYRLLGEIKPDTLVVIDECLRERDRSSLTYNCIRHYLNQTKKRLIFQWFPIIETLDDFMILLDFETGSRFKGQPFDKSMLAGVDIGCIDRSVAFESIQVAIDSKTAAAYAKEKRKLIDNIGLKDPHTIPRNLYLVSGKAKAAAIDKGKRYVGRNDRLKLQNLKTYGAPELDGTEIVFEFPHSFGTMADHLAGRASGVISALVADTKCDQWYFQRYVDWSGRLGGAYVSLGRSISRGELC